MATKYEMDEETSLVGGLPGAEREQRPLKTSGSIMETNEEISISRVAIRGAT